MTNAPVAGWYQDPEIAGQLRYWDGALWTEHVAATPQIAPAPGAYYSQPRPQHVTLFNNPYEKPPRTRQATAEDALGSRQRAQAAAIDAALVIPLIVLGFGLGPLLGWISGDSAARGDAYQAAALVLAFVLGISLVVWNFVIRDVTVGTEVLTQRGHTTDGSSDQP